MVDEDAEGVHIGGRRGERTAEALGCVVGVGGERDDPSADLVDTEVGDECVVLGVEQHVLRPNTAVHDAVAVGRGDACRDRLEDGQRVGGVEPAAGYALAEVSTGQ